MNESTNESTNDTNRLENRLEMQHAIREASKNGIATVDDSEAMEVAVVESTELVTKSTVVNSTRTWETKQYAWFVISIRPEFNASFPRDSFSYRFYVEPANWYALVKAYHDAHDGYEFGVEGILEMFKTDLVPSGKAPDIMEHNSRLSFTKTEKKSTVDLQGVCIVGDDFYKVCMIGTCSHPTYLSTPSSRAKNKEWILDLPCEYKMNTVSKLKPDLLEEPDDMIEVDMLDGNMMIEPIDDPALIELQSMYPPLFPPAVMSPPATEAEIEVVEGDDMLHNGRKYIFLGTMFPNNPKAIEKINEVIGACGSESLSKELPNMLAKWETSLNLSDSTASYFVFNGIRSMSGSAGVVVFQNGELVDTLILGRA